MKSCVAWILATLLLATAAVPAAGQLCESADQLLAVSLRARSVDGQAGGAIAFSVVPIDYLLAQADLEWGGLDTGDETPRGLGFAAGARVRLGDVGLCPGVRWRVTRYDFIDRFDADRGSVIQQSMELVAQIAGSLPRIGGLDLGWRIDPSFVFFAEREIARRILILEVPPRVATDTQETVDRAFEGTGALTLRIRRAVVAMGAGTYGAFERRTRYFVEVSWLLQGS